MLRPLSILVLLPALVCAGEIRDLGPILRPLREQQHVPGMAAAVLRDGRVVAAGAVGVRKAGRDEPLTINDKFHIGACAKAMTATLAAIMVSERSIRWDSSVGSVFRGEYKIDDAWNDVTLAQLLTHRGGAPADLPPSVFATQGQKISNARRLLVREILADPPGDWGEFVYSKAGYVIAGHMLEIVGDDTWESLIRKKLFAPLNITSAGFGAPGLPGIIDQPRGHRATTLPVEPSPFSDNPLAIGPAGTVHMTLGDWLKFVALHLRAARAAEHPEDNVDLLGISADSFRRMRTAPADSATRYAYGWIIAKSRLADINILTHDGSNNLWYAKVWASPRLNLAVVIVANQGSDSAIFACREAQEAILKLQLDAASNPDARHNR